MSAGRRLHLAYRTGRTALLMAAGPIDTIALRLNGRRWYPPIHLRRQAGPLAGFQQSAAEFVGILAAFGALTPSTRIVDVGSGPGALAVAVHERLGPEGRYLGFDVHRPSVAWAQKHRPDDRFSFRHHDYWNASHNPKGRRLVPMPVDDASADLLVAKSVFTHMLPDDVAFYLAEAARVLRPDGLGFFTAYCFDTSEDVEGDFPHRGDRFRYRRAWSPESALALDQQWLVEEIRSAGLHMQFLPGYWRPRPASSVTYQDLLVLSHATARQPLMGAGASSGFRHSGAPK